VAYGSGRISVSIGRRSKDGPVSRLALQGAQIGRNTKSRHGTGLQANSAVRFSQEEGAMSDMRGVTEVNGVAGVSLFC